MAFKKGISHSQEHRNKISKALTGKKRKIAAWNKGLTKETDERVNKIAINLKGHLGSWFGKTRPNHSKKMKGRKQTKEHIENRIKKIRGVKRPWMSERNKSVEFQKKAQKGSLRRPTSYEKIIINIINKYNFSFKYVGDGEFWIKRMNPDFINKDKKICIEVFCDFYKERAYGSVEKYILIRNKKLMQEGWKTIFISSSEIFNEKDIVNKINEVVCSA